MTGQLTQGPGRSAGDRPDGPLIVTEDVVLLDDLLRLCAAAGARPEVHHTVPEARTRWEAAPLVIVGDDAAERVRGGAPRRDGVLLVGRDEDDAGVWRRGMEIGAEQVLVLPDGERWLVDRIADVAEGAGQPAFTVGVIGGSGGAGASTLACALAVASARDGRRTTLVDADPLGGGLDILLGGESTGGLRWPAFAESRGRVSAGALEESLPELHGLRLLSWDRGDTVTLAPEAVRAVLAAARRSGGAVVVDLPRRVDENCQEILAQLDLGLLVVPPELRAVAAARQVATGATMLVRDLRFVVGRRARGAGAGLDAEDIAELLALPLAGELPAEPGLLGTPAATGAPPGSDRRGRLGRFCAQFWAHVPATGSAS